MSLIKPGALVFDIGAHYGDRTKIFSQHGAGWVICVEPCQKNFTELLTQIKAHSLMATPLRAACLDIPTIRSIFISPKDSGFTTMLPDKWTQKFPTEMEHCSREYVPTTTIDALSETFGTPQYIKIDVEGVEYAVLCGMTRRFPEFLEFEFHRCWVDEALRCVDYMLTLGYGTATLCSGESDLERVPDVPTQEFYQQLRESKTEWGTITMGGRV